ncbi:hypothetical protein [uncultured Sphingomonas sp.]|uniref:hypothetical protein n=1 Tax=uncultured Sphingomonas sp. TaxID=158754 RepID=UPI0035CB96A1
MADTHAPAAADPPPAIGSLYRATLGMIAVLGGLLIIAGLFFVRVPESNKEPLMIALGIVLGWGGAVVTFEFGASATGRKAAEQAIDAVTR